MIRFFFFAASFLLVIGRVCQTNSNSASFICCVQASLERGVAVCRGTSQEEMVIFETETMSMAMGLLTAVMAGAVKVLAL